MIEFLVLVLTFTISYIIIARRNIEKKPDSTIPGPKGWPFIGNALLGMNTPEDIFAKGLKLSESYPRLAAAKLGTHNLIFLFDPVDVEIVMKSKDLRKAREYDFLKPWLGNSLGMTDADTLYKIHKKMILPAFQLNILKGFFNSFNKQSTALIESVKKYVDVQIEFDIMNYLYSMQMSILLETQLGLDNESLATIGVQYGHATTEVCKIIHKRMYSLWIRPDFIFNLTPMKKRQDRFVTELRNITQAVINQKKAELARRKINNNRVSSGPSSKMKTVFLDVLLEAAASDTTLTDDQIRDEVMFMMFAGQDTSAITVAFALCLLGYYPEVQDKVRNELDEVLGHHFARDQHITYDDTTKLKYLNAVIHETLRLYPSVPLLGRTSTKDIHLDGHTIPKGSSIAIAILKIHRNDKYYFKPNEFMPERFLEERLSRHPYSYMPFSVGQRSCLGSRYSLLSMKVTLAAFLWKYRVTSTRHPSTFKLLAETTLKRKEGFPIFLHKRQRNQLVDEC